MSCLHKLADVLEQITYNSMSSETIAQAKSCIADYLSIFVAGKGMRPAQELQMALGGEAIFHNSEDLSFWMGGATRLLDLDDGHRFAMGHPGVPIMSAAFATVQIDAPEADGTLFLEAVVRAYETYCYLGRCINPSAYLDRGFDATCVCGASAAAVAAGTLRGLNKKQIKNAIAIAASLCGGLNQYVEDGSSPKYLCAGWAAKLGICASKLAINGLTGPEEIFEGRLGYCHGFAPKVNERHLMEPKLNWEINYVYLKKFSCVRRIHTTLDCIEEIMEREKVLYSQIQRVNVFGGRFIASAGTYAPETEVKAQTCVPYVVALLLRYGAVTLESIESNLKNCEIEELSRKVAVIEDEAFNQLTLREPSLWGAVRVEVLLDDGRRFCRESHVAIGDPEKPFSKEALHNKFLSLVKSEWNDEKSAAVWNIIQTLDSKQTKELLFQNIYT